MADVSSVPVTLASSTPFALTDVLRTKRRTVSAQFFPATADGPAVVVLARGADCGRSFARRGVATLVVDPHAARPAWRATEAAMLADAFAALAFLAAWPGVDRETIAIVGEGACGAAALLSAYAQIAGLFAAGGARFAAHVCVDGAVAARLEDYRTTGAVVAVLGGEGDAAERSRRALVIGDLREGGSRVEEITFAASPPDPRRRRLGRDVRITPDNVMLDDRSGRRVGSVAGRARILAGALAGPHRDGSGSAQVESVLTRYVCGEPAPAAAAASSAGIRSGSGRPASRPDR